jgi:hypothetical protein
MELIATKQNSKYKVSKCGTVVSYRNKKGKKKEFMGGYRLAVSKNGSGYCLVNIDSTTYSLHRVVAMAWIPNPNNLPQVNHIDGNKSNNNVDNLEWCTAYDNIQHAKANDLVRYAKGSEVGSSFLVESQVEAIIEDILKGLDNMELSEKYNIPFKLVSLIRNKKRWKHVWNLNKFKDAPIVPSAKQRGKFSTEEQANIIKEAIEAPTIKEVADKYNIDRATISRCRTGKVWTKAYNYYIKHLKA